MLFGERAKTISEWTLRLFMRALSISLTALKQADKTCFLDNSTDASRKAYSKLVLPSSSCWRRKPAFCTSRKRHTWRGCCGEWGRVVVSMWCAMQLDLDCAVDTRWIWTVQSIHAESGLCGCVCDCFWRTVVWMVFECVRHGADGCSLQRKSAGAAAGKWPINIPE